MIARDFQIEDLDAINEWMEARGLRPVPRSMLPETGRIVPGVAAGFLFQTDSAIAMLDHFVSNPGADYDQRQAALDGIAEDLLGRAKALGFMHIIAMTKIDGIRDRALRLGFHEAGISCILVKEN